MTARRLPELAPKPALRRRCFHLLERRADKILIPNAAFLGAVAHARLGDFDYLHRIATSVDAWQPANGVLPLGITDLGRIVDSIGALDIDCCIPFEDIAES